jgi:hypothetical protein
MATVGIRMWVKQDHFLSPFPLSFPVVISRRTAPDVSLRADRRNP